MAARKKQRGWLARLLFGDPAAKAREERAHAQARKRGDSVLRAFDKRKENERKRDEAMRDRADARIEQKIRSLRNRSDELYEASQFWDERARTTTKRTVKATAEQRAQARLRKLDIVNDEIARLESVRDRIRGGDKRAIYQINPARRGRA